MRRGHWPLLALLAALVALLAACGAAESVAEGGTEAAARGATEPLTLRLGYFPNITHAPALVGLEEGIFAEALGEDVTLEPVGFNAGPQVVEAMFAEALDISYIGPNPAINAFAQSQGEAIRIISGSTSGGAYLVTKPGITSAEDLRGARIATPQLGNTQDVALRAWLSEHGLTADTEGGGDVAILPQENSQTLETFQTGDIDGAWVPEPWATRLIQEGGAQVLVDERELWDDGRYVTTHVIVRTAFLDQYPEVVRDFLAGHVQALAAIEEDAEGARAATNAGIEAVTGKPLAEELIATAWENLEFTADPVAASLEGGAQDAVTAGLLEPVELDGIYDLELLNAVLEENGKEPVEGL